MTEVTANYVCRLLGKRRIYFTKTLFLYFRYTEQ